MAYPKKNNSNQNQNSSNVIKKHSGCKTGMTKPKSGEPSPYTQGWNFSKQFGMVTYLAVCTKGTHLTESRTGRSWLNVMVKVQRKNENEVLVSGLMDSQTGKVIIDSFHMVLNPKAPNGGYCGKIGKS